jgi:hypothetical protein
MRNRQEKENFKKKKQGILFFKLTISY